MVLFCMSVAKGLLVTILSVLMAVGEDICRQDQVARRSVLMSMCCKTGHVDGIDNHMHSFLITWAARKRLDRHQHLELQPTQSEEYGGRC